MVWDPTGERLAVIIRGQSYPVLGFGLAILLPAGQRDTVGTELCAAVPLQDTPSARAARRPSPCSAPATAPSSSSCPGVLRGLGGLGSLQGVWSHGRGGLGSLQGVLCVFGFVAADLG